MDRLPATSRTSSSGSVPPTTADTSHSSTNQKTLNSFVEDRDWPNFTSGCTPEFREILSSVVHRENIPNVHQGSEDERAIAQYHINLIALHCIATGHSALLCEILKRGGVTKLALTNSPGIFKNTAAIKTLTKMLQEHEKLTELDLGGNDLTHKGLEALAPALKASKLTSLSLRANNLFKGNPAAIVSLMDKMKALTVLDISGNDMRQQHNVQGLKKPAVPHMKEIQHFCSDIFVTRQISQLTLKARDFANDYRVDCTNYVYGACLGVGITSCPTLTSLDVSGCHITPVCLAALAPKGLNNVISLNLSNNDLQGPEGAYAIQSVVEGNPNLTSIHFENNMTGPDTAEDTLSGLMYELYKSKTLTEFTYTHPVEGTAGFTNSRDNQIKSFVQMGGEAITELANLGGQWFPPEMGHAIASATLENVEGGNQPGMGPVRGLGTLYHLVKTAEILSEPASEKEKGV